MASFFDVSSKRKDKKEEEEGKESLVASSLVFCDLVFMCLTCNAFVYFQATEQCMLSWINLWFCKKYLQLMLSLYTNILGPLV